MAVRNQKICPTCGEENRMYFGHNLWCAKCQMDKIAKWSKEEVRKNNRKINLGMFKSGKCK